MKKDKLLKILIIVTILISLSACGKGEDKSNMSVIEESIVDLSFEKTPIEDEILFNAVVKVCDKYEVEIDSKELSDFYKENYKRNIISSESDLINSLELYESVYGIEAAMKKIVVSFVEPKLKEKIRNSDAIEITEEKIQAYSEHYKDQMDTLGIVDSVRNEYIRKMLESENEEIVMIREIEEAIKESTIEAYKKYAPDKLNIIK